MAPLSAVFISFFIFLQQTKGIFVADQLAQNEAGNVGLCDTCNWRVLQAGAILPVQAKLLDWIPLKSVDYYREP